jgi:hypothetical protein
MKLKTLSSVLALLFVASLAMAASKKEARVTQIVRDVKILPADAAARAAVVNDRVADDTGVRTGGDSRSELTFADLTITRLGSNTIFSFNKAGRNAQVDSGSILLRVPKDSGGGRIKTSAVTVAVTGTTVILESVRGRNKLYVLEGGARVSLVKSPKQFQYVRGAQMVDVPPGATTVPQPTNFDLNDLMNNHPLITGFPPLPSRDLIAATQPPPAAPPPSGPSVFPILPVINFGGGFNTGPRHHPPRHNPPGHNPPGNNQPPSGPSSGHGDDAGPGKTPPPKPPPVIYKQTPGQTRVQPVTKTQTIPKSTTTPKKKPVKKPTQNNNAPR